MNFYANVLHTVYATLYDFRTGNTLSFDHRTALTSIWCITRNAMSSSSEFVGLAAQMHTAF